MRPEHIQIGAGDIALTIAPTVIERLGAQTVAYASLDGEGENFCATLPGSAGVRPDQPIVAGINVADCHLFDATGISFERHVALTDIDINLLNPTAA